MKKKLEVVAPHAGAWIEIKEETDDNTMNGSHPMRVRGLKYACICLRKTIGGVAPHAGAWIEICRVPFQRGR